MRYNIKGEKIYIVYCRNCGHQVDVSNVLAEEINGYIPKYGDYDKFDSVRFLDKMSICCKKPDYSFID